MSRANESVQYTYLGRSRCFVFDKKNEVAKFTYRQNQSVKVRLFVYMCLYPLPTLRGFQQILDSAKILFFLRKRARFIWKKNDFRGIKQSDLSHFATIIDTFLRHSFWIHEIMSLYWRLTTAQFVYNDDRFGLSVRGRCNCRCLVSADL